MTTIGMTTQPFVRRGTHAATLRDSILLLRPKGFASLFLFALSGYALGAPARAETVDRVVAVVDGEPILASDLALDEALRDIDPSPIPFWRASADPLETAIEVVLIRHLASDVGWVSAAPSLSIFPPALRRA